MDFANVYPCLHLFAGFCIFVYWPPGSWCLFCLVFHDLHCLPALALFLHCLALRVLACFFVFYVLFVLFRLYSHSMYIYIYFFRIYVYSLYAFLCLFVFICS